MLVMEVSLERMRGAVGKAKAEAKVDGKTVASGELTFALGDLA